MSGRNSAALALLAAVLMATPAAARQRPESRQQELDRLYKSLKTAPNEQAAAALEARIRAVWIKQGSPAAVMLLSRGDRDLQGGAAGEAVADFDAVLVLEPEYAEGFNRRAAARAALGDYAGAVADIQQVLARDPRHFSALQGLSLLAEQQGDWKGALAAWQKALDIDPRTPGGLKRLEMLQDKVDGQAT